VNWSWTILGSPVGKGRARVFRNKNTGRVHGVTPDRTRNWEAVAVEVFACHWDGAPTKDPVRLDIVAVFPRPRKYTRKKDPPTRIANPCRPDADNCAKSVMDAMQKAGVIRDDSQACAVSITKLYAAIGEGPRVEVTMSQLDPYGYAIGVPRAVNFNEIPF